MIRYKVELHPKAKKGLARMPKREGERIAKVLASLRENPWPEGCSKMVGYSGVFRIRVGNYRAIYGVEGDTVRVFVIGHRKGVYR